MAFLAIFLVVVIGGLLWVRFAPTNPSNWHVDPTVAADPGVSGVLLQYMVDRPDALSAFADIAMGQPNTRLIAGSVSENCLTFETRTKWVGFPDYITVTYQHGALVILSRLRYGRSDLGVNKRRLKAWLQSL